MVQAVEAYKEITATQEFQYLELLREKTRRDEAQAISNAKQLGEQLGEQRADKKWQGVIAEKDTTLAQKDIMIAELLAKLEKLS